jgi:hypothetical protein
MALPVMFYICFLLVLFVFYLKYSRPQIVEIDQVRIDKVQVLEKIKLSSDSEELSEFEESQQEERQVQQEGSVNDDSTLSHDNETVSEKAMEATDENTFGFTTGSSTPRNNEPETENTTSKPHKLTKPLFQSDLEVFLASFQLGRMMLTMEVIFDKSTEYTASTLRKIVPVGLIRYLKKCF